MILFRVRFSYSRILKIAGTWIYNMWHYNNYFSYRVPVMLIAWYSLLPMSSYCYKP